MSRGDIIRNINQLKADSGVPFVTELQRIDTLDNPVLIIGIGGTGIDLSIVRAAAKAHGGTISAEVNGNTITFRVRI